MNRLFAPGPLMRGHENLEGKECLKCHDSSKGVPDSKCLECHKEINDFVSRKAGYHGMLKDRCISCHSDHKGRENDTSNFNVKTFDHRTTGYTLVGKHAEITCKECHKKERGPKRLRPHDPIYLGSSAVSCRGCHEKDDVHFYKGSFAKKDCNACHGLSKWDRDIKFDHTKDGHFKLEGSHDLLTCNECHNPKEKGFAGAKYRWPNLKSASCMACHDNYHHNTLSSKFQDGKCNQCHSQEEWKILKFNHSVTNYPLRGKHEETKCLDCHKPKDAKVVVDLGKVDWRGLKQDCLSCHKDFHRYGHYKSMGGWNNLACLKCHDESAWKNVHDFSHSANTRFKIDGEHKDLECAECHLELDKKPIPPPKPGIYVWPNLTSKTCEVCHASPHTKEFSKELLAKRCTDCHVTEGWAVVKSMKNFNHDATRFPLTGKHREASCTECHVKNKKQIFKWNSKDAGFCIECHDNVHDRQFDSKFSEQSCKECHTTKDWIQRLTFDHAKTRYPLKGAHAEVKCETCHTPTQYVFPVKPGHHMGKYVFPDLQKNSCLACHQDVHKGQLSRNCTECHTEAHWKPSNFNHQKQSRYHLLGKHVDVKCEKCHATDLKSTVRDFNKVYPSVHFKPIGTQCLNCHKDAHQGRFGNACTSCHTEQTWHVTKDFHKNFTLTGVHFTLQCTECHGAGRTLSGLSGDCVVCHKKDDVHSGTLPECATCHLQSMWENSKFRHSMTTFPLKGAHRTLQCQDCHSNGVYQGLSTACVACHLADAQGATRPVHSPNGSFTNCTDCHHGNSFSW